MQSIIILFCLQIHTFLSTWNRLISVTKHNNQERDIMEAREIYYSLWEWSTQLWTHTATITCLLIYVLKQPKMYKVGKIRLAVIVIVKLVHSEGTFCLHWMLWPLCDILLAASLRALGKGSTLMLVGVGLRCSLSFLMLPFHSSQLWSRNHQSLRAVKLIKEGGTNHKTQPKAAKTSACVWNTNISEILMIPLWNNQFTWLEVHGKTKQNNPQTWIVRFSEYNICPHSVVHILYPYPNLESAGRLSESIKTTQTCNTGKKNLLKTYKIKQG